jgi:hypothetical protein
VDPEEKAKKEAERRKQREEFMKNWNEKWKKREEKNTYIKESVSPTVVSRQQQDAPPQESKTRNVGGIEGV